MFFRILSFLLLQIAGGLAGYWVSGAGLPHWGPFFGALAGGFAWLLIDAARGMRLMRWLQHGESTEIKLGYGFWSEVAERTRRQFRARERRVADGETKLQDFLAALQASPNGVVLLDASGRIEWFNQMAGQHFGFDARRDMLQHFGNLVRDPGFATYYTGHDFSHGLVMPGRESTGSKPVKLSVHLHPYGEGRNLLLSRDITAVEQAEAMRRDFVANVSHEIRTPLTVLAGFVETLQTLPLDEAERHSYLNLMSQQASRMQSLVNDLLTLSRLEGSPAPSGADLVDMVQLLQQCKQEAHQLSSLVWGKAQDIQFLISDAVAVTGSPTELHSAVANLIGNAIRYTPADKSIQVHWRKTADGLGELSVQDTGPGIAPEHIPRLTERFYRVDRSRSRDTGGTGLGLAIVKHVAQRHGAELLIESIPGRGSTFTLRFKAARLRLQ
ncbi:phosphate regulon sensor histidine kinase PhoR [Rhodoferax bucti]|uniref:phosphate regulon sensor histidine kinase PhoR n=1 Tax=Rhodoferax bucti TaxID=2576305 RepID=UPI001109C3DB|nr:phosphate regulon sensor histidine kinase PhoR [Rhodoferax bucti]